MTDPVIPPVDPIDTQDSGHGDPPPKHPPSVVEQNAEDGEK